MAPFDDLDAPGLLALAQQRVVERRAGELEELRLAAHWAVLHSTDPRTDPGHTRVPGCDRLVTVGGEGTPPLRQLSLAELGIAFDCHTNAARSLVADTLDLQHRLPLIWAAAQALRCEIWVVRQVARMTRQLPMDAVGLVDVALAPVLATLPAGRLLSLAEAKVIEADPEAHAERVAAELRRRFVGISRADEHGLRTIYARLDAGDAAWFDAVVEQLADILDVREDLRPDTPRDLARDELRALAFGWLARPAEALQLILESTQAASAPLEEVEPPSRAVALSERALELLTALDLSPLRPKAQVFVHLHEDVLTRRAPGVARVEGLGPQLLAQLVTLLGHTNITMTPVIDLGEQRAVDGYEHPTTMKTRARLRSPVDGFPASVTVTGTGRPVDLDHPVTYDEGGPPGQTSDTNAQPLTRGHHRAKTHLPYLVWIIDSTTKLWKTPNGLWRIVDHLGTHHPVVVELDPAFSTRVA